MGGNNEWDNRLTESLKNFNLSSPEIKQQFGKSKVIFVDVNLCLVKKPTLSMLFFSNVSSLVVIQAPL